MASSAPEGAAVFVINEPPCISCMQAMAMNPHRNCSTHPLWRSALKLQVSFGDSQEWEIPSAKIKYATRLNQH
jgi:hypothetical protein